MSGNYIFLPLRELVGIEVIPDTSGAGDSTGIKADVHGVRRVMAELVNCPICAGQWTAMVCLALYGLDNNLGSVFTYALAAAGIGEAIHWYAEAQEWTGRNQREQAGTQWLDKNERAEVPVQTRKLPENMTLEDLEFYLELIRKETIAKRQLMNGHAERVHIIE